jgi:hypothetical protein
MNQINKLKVFLSSLALLAALLLGGIEQAEACGSYGPQTDEEQVSMAVYEMFWSAQQRGETPDGEWLEVDSIEVTAGRVATVRARTRASEDKPGTVLQFALYNLGDQWTVARDPSMTLLVTSLKHALDANVKAALNKSHDAVKLTAINPQRVLHSFSSFEQ